MATTVYNVEELTLQDGSVIICKPAPISVLRKGNRLLEKMGDISDVEDPEGDLTDDDKGIRKLLDVVALCLVQQRPEFKQARNVKNEDGSTTTKSVTDYDLMESLFDLETMFKVIELFLGWKLNDPNLVEAASQLALLKQQQEEKEKESDGTVSTSQTEKEKPSN